MCDDPAFFKLIMIFCVNKKIDQHTDHVIVDYRVNDSAHE